MVTITDRSTPTTKNKIIVIIQIISVINVTKTYTSFVQPESDEGVLRRRYSRRTTTAQKVMYNETFVGTDGRQQIAYTAKARHEEKLKKG